jgi:hypothetical protein
MPRSAKIWPQNGPAMKAPTSIALKCDKAPAGADMEASHPSTGPISREDVSRVLQAAGSPFNMWNSAMEEKIF